jgi:hypothetical protein
VVGSYHDRLGSEWLVVIRRLAAGRWQVCELAEQRKRRVIDELSGQEESQDTALAVAHDYLRQQQRQLRRRSRVAR